MAGKIKHLCQSPSTPAIHSKINEVIDHLNKEPIKAPVMDNNLIKISCGEGHNFWVKKRNLILLTTCPFKNCIQVLRWYGENG